MHVSPVSSPEHRPSSPPTTPPLHRQPFFLPFFRHANGVRNGQDRLALSPLRALHVISLPKPSLPVSSLTTIFLDPSHSQASQARPSSSALSRGSLHERFGASKPRSRTIPPATHLHPSQVEEKKKEEDSLAPMPSGCRAMPKKRWISRHGNDRAESHQCTLKTPTKNKEEPWNEALEMSNPDAIAPCLSPRLFDTGPGGPASPPAQPRFTPWQ